MVGRLLNDAVLLGLGEAWAVLYPSLPLLSLSSTARNPSVVVVGVRLLVQPLKVDLVVPEFSLSDGSSLVEYAPYRRLRTPALRDNDGVVVGV
jgi:hypothetical protein